MDFDDVREMAAAARRIDVDGSPWQALLPGTQGGLVQVMTGYAGQTFAQGTYSLLREDEVLDLSRAAERLEPELGGGQFSAFATDWLARIYGCFEGEIYSIDPQSGSTLGPLARDAYELHVESLNTCLEVEFLTEWLAADRSLPEKHRCVGLDIPLFLGGDLSLENASEVDREVYWEITAQLCEQARQLANGTKIEKVESALPARRSWFSRRRT